jgi:superfamily I DNA and/or RNA helicase
MENIGNVISKAIKESKWLSVEYLNSNNDLTYFWCAIKDIEIVNKKLLIDAFNVQKSDNTSDGLLTDIFISFEGIKKAVVVEGTNYSQNTSLITKIEANLSNLTWLNYSSFNNNTINYIRDCLKYDTVPYLQESDLVEGLDEEKLNEIEENGTFKLNLTQFEKLVKNLKKQNSIIDENKSKNLVQLSLNILSIYTKKGLFVLAYKPLLLNPLNKTLVLDNNILFNYDFSNNNSENFKHSIKSYLDLETEAFVELFKTNREEAKEMLSNNLRADEKIDDRPYIYEIVREFKVGIDKEFNALYDLVESNDINSPLKAFFGKMNTSLTNKKRDFELILIDEKLNIDQLRVLHNTFINPITYVQGPPGTGKTHTIVNLIISSLFNKQTALIASNNNKPIDDIYNKILDYKLSWRGNLIPLPILRLGNTNKVKSTLENIKNLIKDIDLFPVDENILEKNSLRNINNLKEINDLIEKYENKLELEEQIDALESMNLNFKNSIRSISVLASELNLKKAKLSKLDSISEDLIKEKITTVNDSFKTWLFSYSLSCLKKLDDEEYFEFLEILNIEKEDKAIAKFNAYMADQNNFERILKVFPIIMSTNQSVPRLGMPKATFDIVVLDEAGQCSLGYALFPIIRAKKLLLVGDQNQLSPVISLPPEINLRLMKKYNVSQVYDYVDNSILKTMQTLDSISKFVLLRHHYRSHPDIIEFSNQKYYNRRLIVETKTSKEKKDILGFLDTSSKPEIYSNDRNTSVGEIEEIIADIKLNKKTNIGIITPFRNQALLIQKMLKASGLSDVTVGTIHTFQGDEKDHIYLSCGITKSSNEKAFEWVKNNKELINVAMTRARQSFTLVGNESEINNKSKGVKGDLNELIEYVKKKGIKVKLTESTDDNYVNSANYKQYNTKTEKELYDTIIQVLSLNERYVIKEQVPAASIFKDYPKEYFDYFTRARFDFVLFQKDSMKPTLIIELDGDEHFISEKIKRRDVIKKEICIKNNIELIKIPNNYSRRYVFVKQMFSKLFDN